MNRNLWIRLFIIFMVAVCAQPVLAQDQLGIYFDASGTTNTITTTAPYSQVPAWVQLTDPTCGDSISGFEFRLEVASDGPEPILVWTLPAQAINGLTEPSFMVGLGTPLAAEPRVTLAEVMIIVPEAGQTVWLTLHPIAQPSLLDPPGYGYPVCQPSYACGDNGSFNPMSLVTQCASEPVASINGSGPPPQIQFSELPEVISVETSDDKAASGALVLTNVGPVSFSGIVSVTGSTPVELHMDGSYYTPGPLSFQVPMGETVRIAPYFSGDEFVDAALQMEICGEVWSIPILSRDDLGGCEWDTDFLDFGEVPVGFPVYERLVLTNTGYEDLTVPLDYSAPPFLVSKANAEATVLHVGQSCNFNVRFYPYTEGGYSDEFSVDGLCSVMLIGSATIGEVMCGVSVPAIDFVDFHLGQNSATQYFYIQNTGGGILEGTAVLADTTGVFSLISNASYSLHHLQKHYFGIRFDPDEVGNYSAEMHLNTSCGTIPITGNAIVTPPECAIYGARYANGVLNMRPIPVGGARSDYFFIRNVGGGLLIGDVTIDDNSGAFELFNGGEYSLAYNRSKYNSIRFTPQFVGLDSTVLHTGSICGDILLVGEGQEVYTDCYSSFYNYSSLYRVAVGDTVAVPVRVRNTGYTELEGELELSGGDFEVVNPGPFSLPIGGYTQYEYIRFIPKTVGEHFSTVSTGLDSCPGNWDVTGFAVPAGSDRMGFFIDPEGTINELQTTVPKVQETVYLVLKNPSVGGDLAEWYVNYWSYGGSMVLDDWTTSLPGNIGGGYYYKYFYPDSPVPFTETMVLAEFTVLVQDHTVASMVRLADAIYGYAYDYSVHINNPVSLYINSSKSMLVSKPATPLAELDDDVVKLSWPCSSKNYEGFHVYRRQDGGVTERLTSEPVACLDGLARYDDTTLVPGWSEVSYCVAAMSKGEEGLKGEEVTLLPVVPEEDNQTPSRTRLLAIYPNPFNPETNISFELAQPGRVQIMIYDVGGRLVRTLTDTQFAAGQYEETWNGRDDSGRAAPSNVYYARMIAGGEVQLRKMTLLK